MTLRYQQIYNVLHEPFSLPARAGMDDERWAEILDRKRRDVYRKLFDSDNPSEDIKDEFRDYLKFDIDNRPLLNLMFPGEEKIFPDPIQSANSSKTSLVAFMDLNRRTGLYPDLDDYETCRNSTAFKQFKKYTDVLFFITTFHEPPSFESIYSIAYGMQNLFPPTEVGSGDKRRVLLFDRFDKFFESASNAPQNAWMHEDGCPLANIFLKDMPIRALESRLLKHLIREAPDAAATFIQHIELWPKVEAKIFERHPDYANERKNLKGSLSTRECLQVLKQVQFTNYDRAPALADLFIRLRIPEEQFNRTLELVDNGRLQFADDDHFSFAGKDIDHIPNVKLAWNDREFSHLEAEERASFNEEMKGCYWVKLPNGDPRGLILGKLTDCCQFVGGLAEAPVVDAMTRSNNGLYVMVKVNDPEHFDPKKLDDPKWWRKLEDHAQIVAQSYVWKSVAGNLVLDSVEVSPEFDRLENLESNTYTFLEAFASKIELAGIDRVAVGTKGGLIFDMLEESPVREYMTNGVQYQDSKVQAELRSSTNLDSWRAAMGVLFPGIDKEKIVTPSQAMKIIDLEFENKRRLNTKSGRLVNAAVALASHSGTDTPKLEQDVVLLLNYQFTDKQKFNRLISKEACEMYRRGHDIQYLASLSPVAFTLLVSETAQDAYDTRAIVPAQLGLISEGEISDFIGRRAVIAYQTGKVKFNDLYLMGPQECQILLSNVGLRALQEDGVTLSDLYRSGDSPIAMQRKCLGVVLARRYPDEKIDIHFLKDDEVRLFYNKTITDILYQGQATPSELLSVPKDILQAALQPEAIEMLKNRYLTFKDLQGISLETFMHCSTKEALAIYDRGRANFSMLARLPAESRDALYTPIGKLMLVDYFDSSFEEIIEGGVSVHNIKENLVKMYAKKLMQYTDGDLAKINFKEAPLDVMLTQAAKVAIGRGHISIKRMAGLSPDVAKQLISPQAINMYQSRFANAKQLSALAPERLDVVLSDNTIQALHNGWITMPELVKLPIEKLKIVTSDDALLFYKDKKLTAKSLTVLDEQAALRVITKHALGMDEDAISRNQAWQQKIPKSETKPKPLRDRNGNQEGNRER